MLSEAEEAWLHQAPYALFLGTMKGGTHAMLQSLWEHPGVVCTGHWKVHFLTVHEQSRMEGLSTAAPFEPD
jgi:hypothetical protein